ncbi:MAG: hypothetical protein KA054_03760 [Candidatus Moranbacteria bacterium]|nr:hypothetical protein [Candidatus Moranbacteria bacterium]
MLRDLTLVQLAENVCTAAISVIAIGLAVYFFLCVAGDIRRTLARRRGRWSTK